MKKVDVRSEIGELSGVILHTPGMEVEKMTPQNAERALYSDILNLSVATKEYNQFKGVLQKQCQTFEVTELLADIFNKEKLKEKLLLQICREEGVPDLFSSLMETNNKETARQLIEGVEIKRDNLTRFLTNERYSLSPLHNFFFTRDASMTVYDHVLVGSMASRVRYRETVIMNSIFTHHPEFNAETFYAPTSSNKVKIEGGDVLIARNDVLVIGTGVRTSTEGIDFIIESLKKTKQKTRHIVVQELPESPESFIHLDMVFTFLDTNLCMLHAPVILSNNKYRTIHITIDNGEVKSINYEQGLLEALKKLKIDLDYALCGGDDEWHQEREQWHSGANFLAIKPGVVLGYERNNYTIEALANKGFEVIKAQDIVENKVKIPGQKAVITIAGSELARGGGGARCMSMPVRRKNVEW